MYNNEAARWKEVWRIFLVENFFQHFTSNQWRFRFSHMFRKFYSVLSLAVPKRRDVMKLKLEKKKRKDAYFILKKTMSFENVVQCTARALHHWKGLSSVVIGEMIAKNPSNEERSLFGGAKGATRVGCKREQPECFTLEKTVYTQMMNLWWMVVAVIAEFDLRAAFHLVRWLQLIKLKHSSHSSLCRKLIRNREYSVDCPFGLST